MIRLLIYIFVFFIISNAFTQKAELITQQRIRGAITDFQFTSNGQYLANISKDDPSIHVWDLASEKIIGSLQGYDEGVVAFSFNQIGDELVSVHEDQKIIRWNLDSWEIADSTTLEDETTEVLFNKNKMLVSQRGKVQLFDRSFNLLKTIAISGEIKSMHSTKNFAFVGTSTGQLTKLNWNNFDEKVQKSFSRHDFQDLDVDLEKGVLLVLNNNGSVSEIMLNELVITKNIKPVKGILFGTHYGRVMAHSGQVAYITNDKEIEIYNLEENLVAHLIDTLEKEEINVLAFSPDGTRICASSFKRSQELNQLNENSIKVWNIQRKGLVSELKGAVNPVRSFSFHPEKNWVAILGEGTNLSLWDMDFAEKIMDYELQPIERKQQTDLISEKDAKSANPFNRGSFTDKLMESAVRRTVNQVIRKEPTLVKFSAQGNYLITKLQKDEVRIYKVNEKTLSYEYFAMHKQERINDFITDPDEKYLICLGAGNESVSVVDLSTGKFVRKLKTINPDADREFLNNAISIAYHPKGENFVVCTGRGQILAWNNNFKSIYKSSGSNLFRMGKNAFVTYSKSGDKVYLNGFDGVRGYDIKTFNILGTTKLKMEGTPHPLGTAQDFMVGFDDHKGYIEDLNNQEIQSFPIQANLINAVDASMRDYIGIALKNGEFRIIDSKSGNLLATFVGEADNTLIKTEENYYKVDKEGFDLVSFRIGRKAYPFEQFDAYYNRPDLVLEALKCPDEEYIDLYEQAHERRLKKLNITQAKTPDFSGLPQLSIENSKDIPYSQEKNEIKIKINATSQSHPLKSLRITINSVPIYTQKINGKKYTEEIAIELISGVNKINIYAIDNQNQESLAESITVNCLRNDAPDLYLITVGTSKYKDARFNLNYAAKDAKDLKQLFDNAERNSFYGKVKTYSLTDAEVKKEAFDPLKTFLSKAGRNDQVIFYIAGHGLLDEEYAYYYGTYDVDFLNPGTRGLAYANLEDILAGIEAVKKLLIMDTCHSGEVAEDEVSVAENDDQNDLAFEDVTFRAVGPKLREGTNSKASAGKMARLLFADIRKGTGATVISSAGGVEFAMEGEDWKNGLFTYCLLNGLTNETADLNQDGTIMLSELQNYLINKVGKLSHGKQVPTSRVQNIRLDYPVW